MPDQIRNNFQQETYNTIRAKLNSYRLDSYIRQLETKKGKGKGNIFPFARGLRFSALLIYTIRQVLSGTNLTANWGQIIDNDGDTFSNECDIIIHSKNKEEKKWNGDGNGNHIMDFYFINQTDVKAVISCKSYLRSAEIEVDYCNSIKNFCPKIWLFTECCGHRSTISIRKKAVEIGYENFWTLYTWNKKDGSDREAFDNWKHFVEQLKALSQ